ncbi:Fur family transcriptional regulator [Shewanella waksmanii]|uniref:Fur family transcriptional regulator n=1 Tax=Shewanella waksmanii TaxID=213783 RepID=UPI0037370FED
MVASNKSLERAKSQCDSSNVKLTPKREAVLNALLVNQKACSAYELIDYCRQEFDLNLSAMSIYRILEFLKQQQLVHKLEVTNKYVACAHICCDHQHGTPQFVICESCHRVEEVHISQEVISALEENIKQTGYSLKSPQLELIGLCEKCQSNEK